MKVNFTINNQSASVDATENEPLLWVIRDTLNMKGTKFGCGKAACGACTVHV
ncbi:MAG: 2Fe-2S iron-sulfur cluster-binding protein, partial [Spirosomataceae bacterium]